MFPQQVELSGFTLGLTPVTVHFCCLHIQDAVYISWCVTVTITLTVSCVT